jgi:hypothetical protein
MSLKTLIVVLQAIDCLTAKNNACSQSNVYVRTAGYPSDKVLGTLWRSNCYVTDNDPTDGVSDGLTAADTFGCDMAIPCCDLAIPCQMGDCVLTVRTLRAIPSTLFHLAPCCPLDDAGIALVSRSYLPIRFN